ncbi:MAG: acyltransferase [Verrucomicrobiaceae bacterium]|nr:acyltransferase [Verrucomicrobiaceae bacterium]
MPKLYFPNLNGLRFLAALGVIIHHVEQFKSEVGLPSALGSNTITLLGKGGVYLFFVLSGFLITYLLLEEETKTGTISVRHFYVRRILRTWPLYFLVVALALFVWPVFFPIIAGEHTSAIRHSIAGLACYALLLPNLAAIFLHPLPFAGQTWSIGVEEQFYLVWPVLMKYFKRRIWIILGICVGYGLLFHGFFSCLSTQSASTIDSLMPLAKFMVTFRIDALAFGSLAAWLLHTNHPFLKYLRSPSAYLISTGIAAWLFLRSEKAPSYYPIALSICFAVILLNIVQDRRASLFLETRVMNYLGRISYGIYMWHPVAIVSAFTSVKAAPFSPWIHYPLTLALTVAIAAFSYHFFEGIFIRQKSLFAKVASSDSRS